MRAPIKKRLSLNPLCREPSGHHGTSCQVIHTIILRGNNKVVVEKYIYRKECGASCYPSARSADVSDTSSVTKLF
jgi:hypothetical protein